MNKELPKITIVCNNGIIEDMGWVIVVLNYYDQKIQQGFINKVNKKNIMTCNLAGFKFKADVISGSIFDIKDVSTIRNGTAKCIKKLEEIENSFN